MSSNSAERRLRVLMITEDDPVYVRQFFDVFFAEFPRDRIEIVGVTVSRAFHEPILSTFRRVLRFYGPVDFVKLLPRFLVAKALRRSTACIAARYGLPVLPAKSVNALEYIECAKALRPDLIVSVAAPEIFKSPLLGVPAIGCLNIRSGELPAYRGMMPTFWQMLEGRPHVTVTVHEMVPKLDSGGVVDTLRFPLQGSDCLDRVIIGTKREGARLMLRVLDGIERTRVMPPAQALDMSKARLFKFPQPRDVARFRAIGHRMI
jgi:methionyl-tRNA formyltransferase